MTRAFVGLKVLGTLALRIQYLSHSAFRCTRVGRCTWIRRLLRCRSLRSYTYLLRNLEKKFNKHETEYIIVWHSWNRSKMSKFVTAKLYSVQFPGDIYRVEMEIYCIAIPGYPRIHWRTVNMLFLLDSSSNPLSSKCSHLYERINMLMHVICICRH